jgi:hypothetical protein
VGRIVGDGLRIGDGNSVDVRHHTKSTDYVLKNFGEEELGTERAGFRLAGCEFRLYSLTC